MFPGDSGVELKASYLRSGRIFRSGKRRRRIVIGRGSCSMIGGEDYEIVSHVDKSSCDEEEECNTYVLTLFALKMYMMFKLYFIMVWR